MAGPETPAPKTPRTRTPRAPAAPAAARRPQGQAHPTFGTQTIHRAVTMLREIAAFQKGMRLVDIAQAMALERPTAHRIVKGLVAQGMVMQDPVTKLYRLGHLVYELGLAASPRYNLKEVCQPTLVRLAERSGDSVYLTVRSGFDAVCLDLIEGTYPIRARTMEIGTRRPLGIGAGGVALLLPLPQPETERILSTNAPRLEAFGRVTTQRLQEVIELSRSAGYSINDENVLPGISALGAPIMTRGGTPYAAISIAGISARFGLDRRDELARMILKETRALAKRLDEESMSWE